MDFPPAAYNSCFGLSKMDPNVKDEYYCQNQIALSFLIVIQEQDFQIIANLYTIVSGNIRKKGCLDEHFIILEFWK